MSIVATKDNLFFNTIYRVAFELFLDVGFASVYHIYNMKWENNIDTYSNVVAFLWVFMLTIILVSIPVLYLCCSKRINPKRGRLTVLFEDLKSGSKILMLDHFIFVLRRAALIFSIIMKWNHGLQQNIIFLSASFLVVVWKLGMKPFNRTLLNFQDSLFEIFVTVIMLIYFSFKDQDSELASKGRSNILGII